MKEKQRWLTIMLAVMIIIFTPAMVFADDSTGECTHESGYSYYNRSVKCDAYGMEEHYECNDCGALFILNEDENEFVETTEEELRIAPQSHDWGDWEEGGSQSHYRVCNNCYKYDYEYHTWNIQVVTPPTPEEDGESIFTCNVCGQVIDDNYIPYADHEHQIVEVPAVTPTCSSKGNLHYWKCTICNEIFDDPNGRLPCHANVEESIDRYNHDWSEVTYEWTFAGATSAKVTASRVCKLNPNHVESYEKNTSYRRLVDPTYESEGKAMLTAVFNYEGMHTQVRIVTLPPKYYGLGPIPDNDEDIPLIHTNVPVDVSDLLDGEVHTYRYISDTTDRLDVFTREFIDGAPQGNGDCSVMVCTRNSTINTNYGGGIYENNYGLTQDDTYYIQFKYNGTLPANKEVYLNVASADYSIAPIPDDPQVLTADEDTVTLNAESGQVFTYKLDSSVREYYKVSVVSDNPDDSVELRAFRAGKYLDKRTNQEIYIAPEKDGEYYLQFKRVNNSENPGTATISVDYTTEHSKSIVYAKNATCIEDGNIQYYKCNYCNKFFDEEGNELEENSVIVPAYGHKWTLTQNSVFTVNDYDKETCTGNVTAGFLCTNTPSRYEQRDFNGTAVFTVDKAPTLSEKGSGYFTATFPEVEGDYHTFVKNIELPTYSAKKAFWEPSANTIYAKVGSDGIADSIFYRDGSRLTLSYHSIYYIDDYIQDFYPVRYTAADGTQAVGYFLDGERESGGLNNNELTSVATQIKNGNSWDGTIAEGNNTARLKVTFWGRTFYTDEFDLIGTTSEPHDPEHQLTHHSAVSATCTTEGSDEYWECVLCSRYFSDEAGEVEINENSWVIPANNNFHNYGAWTSVSDTQHQRVCAYDDSHIETADHVWGETTYEWNDDYSSAVGTHTCSVCGKKTGVEDDQVTLDDVIMQVNVAEGMVADAESSANETVVNEAVYSAEQALAVAEVAEKQAEKNLEEARNALNNASEEEREAAQANLDSVAATAAEAKKIKAAASSTLARSKKAAAKVASNKAAAAASAAQNASNSAQAEKYREEAEAQAANAAALAGDAEKASTKAAAAVSGITALASNVVDPDIIEEINNAKTAADASAGVANSAASDASTSSDEARKSASAAKTAVDNKTTAEKTAAAEAKAKTVKTVTVNSATVSAAAIDKAVKAAGGSEKYVTKIVLGKKVKKIGASAFKKYKKVTTIEVKTKKLTKKGVKKSLKGSKVKTIKVKVGNKKANKTYITKYKKFFTKANAGKAVKVK